MTLLLDALEWRGVGGKTTAGYGRLRAVEASEASEAVVRGEAGPELAAFLAWLDGQVTRGVHARDVIPAIEREWAGRLVRLAVEERLEAGRRIRKVVKHVDFKEAAKALSRRIEAGEE